VCDIVLSNSCAFHLKPISCWKYTKFWCTTRKSPPR